MTLNDLNDKADKITDVIDEALVECRNTTQRIMLLSYIQSMIDYLLKDFVKTAYDIWEDEKKENEVS